MKARLCLFGLIAAGLTVAISYRIQGSLLSGSLVPGFDLPQRDGVYMTLRSLRGRVVLLNFWATFCPPCRQEIPSLNRLQAQFSPNDFQVIGVSEDGEGPAAWGAIADFLARVPVDFPILLDEHGHVANAYGTIVLPDSYLIDAEGRLIRRIVGAQTWDHPSIIREVEQHLQQ
jgi:peroxiredoxin